MKRLLIAICLILVFGCAGSGQNISPETQQTIVSTVDMAGAAAFLLVLNNNKAYIPATITALEIIKKEIAENKSLTYDDMMKLIPEKFKGENPLLSILLVDFISQEKPYFETYLSMFDGYRGTIIEKLDRLIMLARAMEV